MGSRVKIKFDPDFPKGIRDEVAAYFERYLPLLGRDLDVITIYWRDQEKSHALINHSEKHREAHVALSASWLSADELDRNDIVAHELAHIFVNRLTSRVEDMLDWIEENTNQNIGFARSTLEAAEEQVVTDLSRTVLRATGIWTDE